MPSSSSNTDQNSSVWLKKHLNVWKARTTSEADAMRLKAYEKIISKSLNKTKYRHPSKCKSEVLNAVKIYRGLSPQFEKFVFDNGDVAQLLNLNGTIPVDYKGNTYNIPVCIWLLAEFPSAAPMGFVVPTKDMQLKVSHYVDHTGKIFMGYLSSWTYPESNLLGLIQACRDAFGELPPVFSKVSSQGGGAASSCGGGAESPALASTSMQQGQSTVSKPVNFNKGHYVVEKAQPFQI